MKAIPKLIHEDGALYTPVDLLPDDLKEHFDHEHPILIYTYPSGEVATIRFPRPNEEHLRGALFDARETGLLPDVPEVLLPDGKTFKID